MVYQNDKDILSYESVIWSTCDILRGVGIKQSEFPNYMMPFFALVMVESRLKREQNKIKQNPENSHYTPEMVIEEIRENGVGYNSLVVEKSIDLKTLCQNDKSFATDFWQYLQAFDDETQQLLGIVYTDGDKFLDLNGYAKALDSKKVLFGFCQTWSQIDLTPFSNSDITTLEEHIKRKWADISAETAGEQYTPDDIIALITEIIVHQLEGTKETAIDIYDMTCGGGNMLFGVEDRLEEVYPEIAYGTFGQELNDQLYALGKIESRFRKRSRIERGNTLTQDKFDGQAFDFIVANPPYGVDWKQVKSEVTHDQTGRFVDYPATSDGQLLFVQHAIAKLAAKGRGIIVLNGSPLFSGDAGSGESNIRKWIMDNDYLEALVQLPTNEFFNTGITTYLWILNKAKPAARKDMIRLVDASNLFKKLKKNKGQKSKEVDADSRALIVGYLTQDTVSDVQGVKELSKYDFYFNKQALTLKEVDVEGRSIEAQLPRKKDGSPQKAWLLKDAAFVTHREPEGTLESVGMTSYEAEKEHADELNARFKAWGTADLSVTLKDGNVWVLDSVQDSLVLTTPEGERTVYGKGAIKVVAKYKKATSKQQEQVEVLVSLAPIQENDHEIIPYAPAEDDNQANIEAFLARWVERPYVLGDNRVGVEVNFNKQFYVPETLRPLEEITQELRDSHHRLSVIMEGIFNV